MSEQRNLPERATRWLLVATLMAWLGVASGCGDGGPKAYRVAGTVTYNGKPPEAVDTLIMFVDPEMKLDADVGKIVNGKFEFKATQGRKRVEIRCTREVAAKNESGTPYVENFIPARYNRESTLEVQVDPHDTNVYSFELIGK